MNSFIEKLQSSGNYLIDKLRGFDIQRPTLTPPPQVDPHEQDITTLLKQGKSDQEIRDIISQTSGIDQNKALQTLKRLVPTFQSSEAPLAPPKDPRFGDAVVKAMKNTTTAALSATALADPSTYLQDDVDKIKNPALKGLANVGLLGLSLATPGPGEFLKEGKMLGLGDRIKKAITSASKEEKPLFKQLLKDYNGEGLSSAQQSLLMDKGIIKDMSSQAGFVSTGSKDVTTKLLSKFDGMPDEITQQQFNEILNRAKKEGIKGVDEQIVKDSIVMKGDKINLPETRLNVQAQLLPLKATPVKMTRWSNIGESFIGDGKYGEIVYQSPIKTSAGDVHFKPNSGWSYQTNSYSNKGESFPNYFSHVRYEDLPNGTTRKILETQSDLMQKENFANEVNKQARPGTRARNEFNKLEPYNSNDPLAQLRTFREEVKRAAKDGKDTLLIPTGETAMKIEGLGQAESWQIGTGNNRFTLNADMLNPKMVGETVRPLSQAGDDWIITDVLGDGKFKAVPKEYFDHEVSGGAKLAEFKNSRENETFDISGKVDSKHFVYKLNEEAIPKEARRMGLVVDGKISQDNGEWWKINIPKEFAKKPVSAFGKANVGVLGAGAAIAGTVAASPLLAGAIQKGANALSEKIPATVSTYQNPLYEEIHPVTHEVKNQEMLNKAVRIIESSDDYQKIRPTNGALGAYQVLPVQLPKLTKMFLGRKVGAQEFLNNPELQDELFSSFIKKYSEKEGLRNAVTRWFMGKNYAFAMGKNDTGKILKDGNGLTAEDYWEKFTSTYTKNSKKNEIVVK